MATLNEFTEQLDLDDPLPHQHRPPFLAAGATDNTKALLAIVLQVTNLRTAVKELDDRCPHRSRHVFRMNMGVSDPNRRGDLEPDVVVT
ncbi:hypothetical protein VKT23_008179 [Stygiomarasmius scandens]|uniref:Uncharacterized protein n=1 Tax=Marasmiellus scandens TaxID=2682957 RepID=A0ABR1JM57_9AGAR